MDTDGWSYTKSEPFHVYPLGDIQEHRLIQGCRCAPTFEDGVWIHNAFDGRELTEADRRTVN